jgi:hypothetical protein
MDNTILIMACIQLLGIEKPVEVVYKTKVRKSMNNTAAYCWDTRRKGEIVKFRLVMNTPVMIESNYDSATIIAHEMIHAKMIEDDSFNPKNHHCERFQAISKELQKNLNKLGFKVGELYTPETDDDGQ